VNRPEKTSNGLIYAAESGEIMSQAPDELKEVGSAELEEACGGSDGTAVGIAR